MTRIKTGIVGLGRLGLHHAMDIKNNIPEAQLIAACSIFEADAEKVRDWGIQFYTDYDEMLLNADIEAVVIVSSSAMHKEHVVKALKAGKHVFCEKPMALNLKECQEMEKIVDSYPELVFQLGFMRRYDPSLAEAKRMICEGKIGRPVMLKATNLDPITSIQGFINFAPTSGGEFLDMAIHDIDLALWYLEDEVDTIYAVGNSYLTPEVMQYGECDNAFAIMKFKNGSMAFLHPGRTAPHGHHNEIEIIGTDATLKIGAIPRKNNIQIYNSEGVLEECIGSFQERYNEAFLLEKKEFFHCIISGEKPKCGAKDGTAATRIAYAANDAYQTGLVVKVEYNTTSA